MYSAVEFDLLVQSVWSQIEKGMRSELGSPRVGTVPESGNRPRRTNTTC